jgi:cytochrome P450
MSEIQKLRFPGPPVPPRPLSRRALAAALKKNALSGFSQNAFEEEMVTRRLFGHQQMVLNRPASIRHVLIDNADNYTRSTASIRVLYPIVGRGLLLAEGEDWKEQRRTAAPVFAPRTIPLLVPHIAAAADGLVADLASDVSAEAKVDILARMQGLALDIAARSMFSLELAEFGPLMRELLLRYAATLGRPGMLDIALPRAIPTWRDLRRRLFRRRWLALIDRLIAARSAQTTPDAPRDLLDLLAGATDPETGRRFSQRRLADQMATMIVAGHATSAVALFWSCYLLASAQGAQEQVAAETADLNLGPLGAAAALPRLIYTRAVVHEALRLYPPAHVIMRRARGADDAGGIAVPARAVVIISPWVLHRHHRLWREPDAFDPSRFLPEAAPPDRFAYLPFGVGPRICIGAQFALTEVVLVLARLIQAYRVGRADDSVAIPTVDITLRPDHPPPFRLYPRGQAQ